MERVANLSERDNRSDSEEADLLSKSRNSFFSMETLIKAIDISNSNNMLLDEAETLFVEVSNMYEGAVRENQRFVRSLLALTLDIGSHILLQSPGYNGPSI